MATFQWARNLAAWVRGTRPVPDTLPKEAANAVVAQSQADIALIAERIASGEELGTVKADFRRAISRNILAQKALARGGWDELRPSDLRGAAGQAAAQFEYLEGFFTDIASGKLSSRQIAVRAVSYADTGRSVYENERLQAKREAGLGMCARILAAADHCSDCVEWAALGFIPVEEMEANYAIGTGQCRNNCHCVLIYKRDEDSPVAPAAERAIESARSKAADYELIRATRMKSDE